MIYTEEQLKEMISPILATLGQIATTSTDGKVVDIDAERLLELTAANDAIVGIITQDRKAFMSNAPSDTSDGYHTFRDLYRIRMLYNAAMFNDLAISDAWVMQHDLLGEARYYFNVHKSYRHFDGELCFGKENYFVVVAELPTGQITNHYKGEFWELFKIPAQERAAKWDGHSPELAAERLEQFIKGHTSHIQLKDEGNGNTTR